jgi:hypothetical protein
VGLLVAVLALVALDVHLREAVNAREAVNSVGLKALLPGETHKFAELDPQVRSVASAYVRALRDGDKREACSLFLEGPCGDQGPREFATGGGLILGEAEFKAEADEAIWEAENSKARLPLPPITWRPECLTAIEAGLSSDPIEYLPTFSTLTASIHVPKLSPSRLGLHSITDSVKTAWGQDDFHCGSEATMVFDYWARGWHILEAGPLRALGAEARP